ncbi:STAS domain-containing protein [Streptomyces minutiscleroticus]|uniref:STAS domain-containing protein n=1 Tax=Streptomyces minutiscleroticus TaxID=68238 RepID=A0A918NDF1_9ACTN|nr:STAS domain-containing protein [Streptomyces minutiscleroticus]GGX59249.1 hypothetical protein GCM10010358_11990 [Streptomyces minutiscleroticus]
MTGLPPTEFVLVARHEPPALTVRVAGELDYDTSEDLVGAVVEHLSEAAQIHDVHLDFSGLTWIDSTGLSALLTVHRHVGAAGATLHLDNRPGVLERMLHMTNVLDHLTAPAAGGQARRFGEDDGTAGAGATS